MSEYIVPKRLEFLVTYLCNGKCRHCYATKHRRGFPKHVDKALAIDIVRKVGERYDVESVMTFGGEPLLFPDITCSIHREVTELGIPRREVITNGYWSNNVQRIREIAKNLAECGINEISVSVDAFHQEHIPLNIVRKAVKSCLEAGIEDIAWNPCWVNSEDDNNSFNRKTRTILKELEGLPVRVSTGNILEPKGLALVNLREFLPPKKKTPLGKCGDMPYTEPLDRVTSMSVEPDGRIAVCNEFHIGNASETDILNILESYNPLEIPEMKAIVEKGMKGLVDWAKKKGVEPNHEGYYSVCHMCTDIRKRIRESQYCYLNEKK